METVTEPTLDSKEGIPLPEWQVRRDHYGQYYTKMTRAKEWCGPYVDTAHAVAVIADHFNHVMDDIK